MKVKLLKKIRKQYTITYYPKGYISRRAYHYEKYNGERMVLTFSKNRYFEIIIHISDVEKKVRDTDFFRSLSDNKNIEYSKEAAYKKLLTVIQNMVYEKYAPLMKRKPNKGVKLFYNK